MDSYYLKYKKYKTKYLNLQYGGDGDPKSLQAGIKSELNTLNTSVKDRAQMKELETRIRDLTEAVDTQQKNIQANVNYINNGKKEIDTLKAELKTFV